MDVEAMLQRGRVHPLPSYPPELLQGGAEGTYTYTHSSGNTVHQSAANTTKKGHPKLAKKWVEDKATNIVGKKLDRMLESLEQEIKHVEERIGDKMKRLDLDGDGLISKDELEQVQCSAQCSAVHCS